MFPVCPFIIGEDSFVITSRQFGIHSCLQCVFHRLLHSVCLEIIMLFSSCNKDSLYPSSRSRATMELSPHPNDIRVRLRESTCDNQNFALLTDCHVFFSLKIPNLHFYHLEIPTILCLQVLSTHVAPRKNLKSKYTDIRIKPRPFLYFGFFRHYSDICSRLFGEVGVI